MLDAVKKLSEEFKAQFPGERTSQLGASSNVPYQFLISSMDGIQEAFVAPAAAQAKNAEIQEPANVVLVSYSDVDAEVAGSSEREKKGDSI